MKLEDFDVDLSRVELPQKPEGERLTTRNSIPPLNPFSRASGALGPINAKTPSQFLGSPSDSKRARAGRKTLQPTGPAAGTRDDDNFIQLTPTEGAGRPPNTISLPTKSGREQDDDRNRKEGRGPAGAAAPAMKEAPRQLRVPDSVQERFIQIGNKFHFPDGAEAFTHDSNRLTTRSENSVVIQSMVAIARENGKGPVTVGGTEFFKKEAWFAASLAGLVVAISPLISSASAGARVAARRVRSTRAAVRPGGTAERTRPSSGRSPRREPPASATSSSVGWSTTALRPMVTIRSSRCPISCAWRRHAGIARSGAWTWSALSPVAQHARNRRRDRRARHRRQPVTVLAAKLDAQGGDRTGAARHPSQPMDRRAQDFLDERQRMAEVLRNTGAPPMASRHPELEGSYMQLQMGRALAEQQFRDKAQREQFVDHLRAHIAQRIEFGHPLDPVMLRGEERTVAPRSQDRDFQPTR